LKNERIGEVMNGGGYQSSQTGNAAAEDGHLSDEDYHGIFMLQSVNKVSFHDFV
jgi:hypothetical protein